MSAESVSFTIKGLTPILMHSGQTIDPLGAFAKAMKKASGKRGKTDDDLAVLSNLEWWAGLYLSELAEIADDLSVSAPTTASLILPAHMMDSVIREGARKVKLGKQASAGCIVEGDAAFKHDGPKSVNDLSRLPKYLARHPVKVGQARVMRTRPIFPVWSATFSVCIDNSVIEVEQVRDALICAGKLVGCGDWRPGAPRGGSFGRFEVVK